MSYLPKIVSLTVVALVSWVGIALAADPKKVPPKLSPSQTPPAKFVRPDLVPKLDPGWPPGGFTVWCHDHKLHVRVDVRNEGTVQIPAGTVRSLVKVSGQAWQVPNNPYTTLVALPPGTHSDFYLSGYSPAPHPITGTLMVSVKVDSENTVVERNENNNVVTATATPCK
jgi:hypothetical protein